MSEGAWPLTVMARETGYMVSTAAASVQRMQSSGTSSSRTWTQRVTAWGTRAHGAEGRGQRARRAQRAEGRGQRAEGTEGTEGTEGRGQRAEGRGPRSHVAQHEAEHGECERHREGRESHRLVDARLDGVVNVAEVDHLRKG